MPRRQKKKKSPAKWTSDEAARHLFSKPVADRLKQAARAADASKRPLIRPGRPLLRPRKGA